MIPDQIADFNLSSHAHSLFGGSDEFVDSVPPRATPHESTEAECEPTSLDEALRLLRAGFWVEPTRPRGKPHGRDGKIATGKEPIRDGWGLNKMDEDWLRLEYGRYSGAGVAVCLGPEKAPNGENLIALDCDSEEAEEHLKQLFGGEFPRSLGWRGERGHNFVFVLNDASYERLGRVLARFGQDGKGYKAGIWNCPTVPTLQFLVGGTKEDEVPKRLNPNAALPSKIHRTKDGKLTKQVFVVVPPSPGERTGAPRTWNEHPDPIRWPEAATDRLEALSEEARERKRPRSDAEATAQQPRADRSPKTISHPPLDSLSDSPGPHPLHRLPRDGSPIISPDGSPLAKALEWVEGYRAERINKAIADSLPKREGERNRRVFDLARMLKLVYPHAHPGDMGKHFDRWWQWAEPVVRTKDVRESWEEFVHAWFVAEAGPFHMAWDRVDRGTRAILTDPRKNALANLMREMSDIQYETKATTKFSLSYNQIGEFLGMTPPNARRDVALPLKEMGLVEIVEKGKRGPKGPATTWRWIGTAKIDNGQESR